MRLIKNFLLLLITIFSLFSMNNSFAVNDDIWDVLCEVFWTCEGWSVKVEQTPLEKAREKLKSFSWGEDFIKKIDDFVENKKSDKEYLLKISKKVKAFDLSQYHSDVTNKDATLAAVIWYIDALLDDSIAKLSY